MLKMIKSDDFTGRVCHKASNYNKQFINKGSFSDFSIPKVAMDKNEWFKNNKDNNYN
jgi:hypothetical protein